MIPQELKEMRRATWLRQKEVAKQMHVHVNTIYRWEKIGGFSDRDLDAMVRLYDNSERISSIKKFRREVRRVTRMEKIQKEEIIGEK
jgi:DNA-binding transcriptional MerR regulator